MKFKFINVTSDKSPSCQTDDIDQQLNTTASEQLGLRCLTLGVH